MSTVNQRHEPGEIVTAVTGDVTIVGELVAPYTSGPGNLSEVRVKVGADTLYLNSNYWALDFAPKPLPTAVGSVVQTPEGYIFALTEDADSEPWRRLAANGNGYVRSWQSTSYLAGATVLFDAGA